MSNAINRFRGDTYPINMSFTRDGNPMDFGTGSYTTRFSYIDKTGETASIVGSNGTDEGVIEFAFPDTVAVGSYTYDVEVEDTTLNTIQTFVKDTMVIVDDVTK